MEHRNIIFGDHYGWPSDICKHMNKIGVETELFIGNAEVLQKKWASENGFDSYSTSEWKKEIVFEQIKQFRPDIVWLPGLFDYFGDFIRMIKPYCKKVVLWHNAPTPEKINLDGIDTLITTVPNIFPNSQKYFEKTIITTAGFSRTIPEKVGTVEKKFDLTFIGGFSIDHLDRLECLSFLLKNQVNLKVFGYVRIPPNPSKYRKLLNSVRLLVNNFDFKGALKLFYPHRFNSYYKKIGLIKKNHYGENFGLDMYRLLAQSRVTLNYHIDCAGPYSGNIRMFEATGMGTCLITNESPHNSELFKLGKEIMTFKNKEDLLYKLKNTNFKSSEIAKISEAGQKRTLQSHSIEKMFESIKDIFE